MANQALFDILAARFARHMERHPGITWADVQGRLDGHPAALRALAGMEATGGEPDVIAHAGELLFCDCSVETPAGRRSVCYDGAARAARRENRPDNSAVEWAAATGVELLTEAQYRQLQELGAFDTKTSSWLLTPAPIRALGGALFCDRRYGHVFTYHNGAQSYYAGRGFRVALRV